MTAGIYGIFDRRDGACLYVGLSKDIDVRWRKHRNMLIRGSHDRQEFTDLFKEINEDLSLLDFRILEECSDDDVTLNLTEMIWFEALHPKFYGKRPSEKEKWILSDETKAKISKSISQIYLDRNMIRNIDRKLLCASCDDEFRSRSTDAKYCSRTCQIKIKAFNFEEYDDLMRSLYSEGYSIRQIATQVGASYPTVRSRLIMLDVKLRGHAARSKKI